MPVRTLDEALRALAGDAPEMMVIGGAGDFELAMPRMDLIHLTRVHCVIEAMCSCRRWQPDRVARGGARSGAADERNRLRDDASSQLEAGASRSSSARELIRSAACSGEAVGVGRGQFLEDLLLDAAALQRDGVGDLGVEHHHRIARDEALRMARAPVPVTGPSAAGSAGRSTASRISP